jgi:hypothetical protein
MEPQDPDQELEEETAAYVQQIVDVPITDSKLAILPRSRKKMSPARSTLTTSQRDGLLNRTSILVFGIAQPIVLRLLIKENC